MIVDQEEIEALLAQAENLADEVDGAEGGSGPALATPPPPKAPPPRPILNVTPEVARLLKIRVPVIVRLAERRMTVSSARRLSLGMIIEFSKHVDDPLDLLINNHPIGKGETVKVGERFGLRISAIDDRAARIRSLGE
jgi:flagellar motor switch protein FliN/FliY